MTPTATTAAILILATYRLTRLAGWDDMPLILQARNKATGAILMIKPNSGDDTPYWEVKRPQLLHFLTCGFCLGFWISLAVYGSWLLWPHGTMYAAVPLAISGAVGLIVKQLDT